MAVPVVILSEFILGDRTRKNGFVQTLGQAFENVGFVAVQNHGIAEGLIADLYKYVQQFFALPLDKKRNYEKAELAGQRGYTSFGKEHAKGSEAPDLKEFFQFGQPGDGQASTGKYAGNIVVNEVPRFYETGFELYKSFETA